MNPKARLDHFALYAQHLTLTQPKREDEKEHGEEQDDERKAFLIQLAGFQMISKVFEEKMSADYPTLTGGEFLQGSEGPGQIVQHIETCEIRDQAMCDVLKSIPTLKSSF